MRRCILRMRQRKLRNQEPQMIYSYKHNGVTLENTRLSSSTVITDKSKLQLADNVFIGHFNFIESSNFIKIAEGVQVTNYISILTHSSHISIRLYGNHYREVKDPIGYKTGKVEIGSFTFIGPHSTILPGSMIGKGCLVSAYSMVKGEFPDFSIIAGNPAQIIGDTREMDKQYLVDNPSLAKFYQEWAK